ncbi:MAG: DUF5050 domain-containing protein [Oscillospiraceae bacterium]|nr:DUF5050 domain-containing protein [Oscillospiraceae bacterium]
MKKILACLAALALLCPLAGCGLSRPEETTTAETTAEITTEPPNFPQTKPMPEGYSFASFYAATPTHFYARLEEGVILRVPRNDFSKKEPLPLPDAAPKDTLGHNLRICGITPEWLLISWVDYDTSNTVVYRVSLQSGEAEFVVECRGHPWYNAGSESLLITRYTEEGGYLEALHLGTGETSLVCDDPRIHIWYNHANGLVLGETFYDGGPRYLCIDANNQAKIEPLKTFWETLEPTKAAHDSWIYYVEGNWDVPKNLYRMKPDGTGKELLEAGTRITTLYAINDKLFAVAVSPQADEDNGWDDVMLRELDAEGKPLWSRPCGVGGEDNGVMVFSLGNMMVAGEIYYVDYGREFFVLLYDPATGQTLEGTR